MKDIVKAIEIEKQYIAYRTKNKEPWHFIDRIKECGFETLDEYTNAKKSYLLSNIYFEVIETHPKQAITDVLNAIANKKASVLFADTEYTLVWNGNDSEFNEGYCYECNIPIYPLYTGGGTIVSTAGDLNIGICTPKHYGIDAQFILNHIADIFRKYTDKTVEVNGNDVLVDGYKVLGSATYNSNEMNMFITPVSFTEKSELISNICVKHSNKQPKHIDFMDSAMMKQEVLEWLTVHYI